LLPGKSPTHLQSTPFDRRSRRPKERYLRDKTRFAIADLPSAPKFPYTLRTYPPNVPAASSSIKKENKHSRSPDASLRDLQSAVPPLDQFAAVRRLGPASVFAMAWAAALRTGGLVQC
jgi:hypothetical protein